MDWVEKSMGCFTDGDGLEKDIGQLLDKLQLSPERN